MLRNYLKLVLTRMRLEIELCKKLGCRFFEKAFKGNIFNANKSIPDEFERLAEHLNRILNYHQYKEGDPMRDKYLQWLKEKSGPK
jgi:hypothetical protein